jgi:hypothetical protein
MGYKLKEILFHFVNGHPIFAELNDNILIKDKEYEKGNIGLVMHFEYLPKDNIDFYIQFPKQDGKFIGIRLRFDEKINADKLNLVNLYRRADLKNYPDPDDENIFFPNIKPYIRSCQKINDDDHKDPGEA